MSSRKIFLTFMLSFCIFVCLPLSNLVFATSYNSHQRPLGYYPKRPTPTNFQIQAAEGNADILLIQSALPWDSDADTIVLDQLGYTYTTVDMSQVPNINLNDY